VTLLVRKVAVEDSDAVNGIANWYIENTAINFDQAAWSAGRRRTWIEDFIRPDTPYHLLVGWSGHTIVGFACNTRFRPKASYDCSTETTVYVDHRHHSLGYGRLLYESLLSRVADEQFHRAYAVITLPNPVSVQLHERLGFGCAGVFNEMGRKFDRYHNVAIYEKRLQANPVRTGMPD